jgi:Na+-driven multidrug efflux pump
VLIFGLGPAPELGIAGAAWATVIARAAGSLILIGYFVSGRTSFRFRPSYFIPRIRELIEIYRVGLSQVVQMTSESLVMGFGNNIAGGFGVVPLALVGVIMRSASFIFMPCVGLAQGALPLIGYNFGAQKYDRIGEAVGKALLLSFLWSLAFFAAIMLFPDRLISIFGDDAEFLRMGVQALRIFALGFPFIGIQIVIGSFFQGLGKGLPSVVLASARHVVFLLPALAILPNAFGLIGLWASFAASSFMATVLAAVWAGYQFRTMRVSLRFRSPQVLP